MKRFMTWCAALFALMMTVTPAIAFAQKEVPGTYSADIQTIKAGSLIIAMDNDKQNIGSLFNIAAYGLVVDLLNANIPVKWAIRTGKLKDASDFTATVARFAPSAQAQTTLTFSGGPFIVEESYANLARARIAAFARNVAVYELKQDAQIDIRYDLVFKPRPFVNTSSSNVVTSVFDDAGITTYKVGPDFTLENSSCYTIIMEPHNEVTTGVNAIRSFVTSGGNFYAQCISTTSFENAVGGNFLSTGGIMEADTSGVLSYPRPDLSFSQFVGAVNPAPGGAVADWILKAGSIFHSTTTSHGETGDGPNRPHYAAMQGKLLAPSAVGGVVFYVGGHSYPGNSLLDANGRRLMLNAVLTPSQRPTVCNIQPLEIPVPDLTLTKSHNGTHLAGTQDSYSFTVSNIGKAPSVDDYTVTDTLPAGLTFVGGSGSGWTFTSSVLANGRTLVTAVNASSLAVNASSSFTITFGITLAAIGTRTNNAYVSGGGEVVTTNNSASVTNSVIGLSGRVFEDLNNIGAEDAADPGFSGLTVTIVDNAATFTTTTDANGNWSIAGTYPNTTATVTIGSSGANSILAGATQSVGSDPSNHATGTSGIADGGRDGFRNLNANISVTKSGPATALVGDTITYVITTTNAGPNPATFVSVTDTLPAGVAYVSSSRSGTLSGNVVTWPSITVNVGGTMVDTVKVVAPASAGAIVNVAAGTTQRLDTNPADNNGSAPAARVTTQLTIPDLTITKSHNGYFTVGADSSYTISIKNIGTGVSLTSIVTDTLPAGLTYQSSAAVRGTWTFSTNGQVVTATLTSALAVNDSASFRITVRPGAEAQPSVTNTARALGARETSLGNNTATDPTTVNAPDITIFKAAQPFAQNANGTYSVKIRNIGTGPSTGAITVVDTLASALTYVSTANVIGTWSFAQSGQVITATYAASLAPGDSAVFSMTVNAGVAAVPSVNNTVRVSGGSDVNLTNNSSTISTPVTPSTDLSLSKTATPNPFVYGANGQYTITVNNIGGQASTGNIVVTDTIPAGLSYLSASGTGWGFATASSNGRTIVTATYTGSLAAITGTTSFTVNVLVMSTAASVTNTGWVSGGGDAQPANNSGTNTNPITARPDLTISKTAPASFTQGTAANYTITVTNIGAGSTSGTSTVTDSIPASLSIGTLTTPQNGWTLSKNGNVVTATSTNVLAQNATASFTIPVTPLAAAVPGVTNKAVVSNASQVNLANDTAYVTTPVSGLPDLSIAKTSSAFTQNLPGTYTITLKNVGTAATSGAITMIDTLAAGITYTSSSSTPAGWTIGVAGQVVTATSSNVMAVNDSAVITLNVDVGAVGTSITNRARVSGGNDSNTANNLATVVTTLVTGPDLTIVKTSSSSFVIGANTKAYRFVVTNSGNGALLAGNVITIVDTLPVNATAVAKNSSNNWTVVFNAATRVMTATSNGSALSAGSSFQALDIDVTFGAGTPASVTNTARVSVPTEVNTTNNSSSVTTPVNGVIDLALTKTSSALFTPGTTGTYTLKVKNVGSTATTANYTVADTLPAGLTLASGSSTQNGWTITVTNPSTRAVISATRTTALAAADSSSFTVSPTVTTAAMPSVYNKGYVSGGNQQASPANDTASVTTPVATPDLTITKTAATASFDGATGTYRITVKNIGGYQAVSPIIVRDTVPTGVSSPVTAGTGPNAAGWTFANTGSSVVATYGSALAAGDSASFTITVNVDVGAPSSLKNRARVSFTGTELSTNNNIDSVTVTVGAQPDLKITKAAATTSFTYGTAGTYTITVQNVGALATSGQITVVDTLASGLVYPDGSTTSNGWTIVAATVSGNKIITATNPGPIASGASSQFSIAPTINVTGTSVANTARVTGGGDANTTNNTSSITTPIVVPDVTIAKAASGTFQRGSQATYTITVTNIGSAATTDSIVVTDTLKAGLSYVSLSGTGWTGSATSGVVKAVYKGTALAAATGSTSFTLTVLIGVNAPDSVVNEAYVAGGGEINTANDLSNKVVSRLGGVPGVTLLKSLAGGPTTALPNDVLTYSIAFTNGGNASAFSVVVSDSLPAQVDYKVGSVTTSFPGAITGVTEFYNGTVWSYVPVTGGCSAPAGYDRCVRKIRWTLNSPVPPAASGSVTFQVRVR